MYTLNLERSAVSILEAVGLLDLKAVPRTLPWRHVPSGGSRLAEVGLTALQHGRIATTAGAQTPPCHRFNPSSPALPLPSAPQQRVRPVHWSNRPKSYVLRTANWNEFPDGACLLCTSLTPVCCAGA